ncbi:MAG TPA: M1 family aminopeptidase [Candidatus Binatia bacterium]|nr:M1 family aminopeptidase [Candidatus Binatia bacterium]
MTAGRKALVRVACLGVLVWVSSTATSAQTLPRTSGPALPLYRALRTDGLDSQQVYKIREAVIDREDVHLWLNDGTIAFTQSIAGKITGAFFRGEGEVLIRPPDRQERASLGLFTGQGVLEEHFSTLYLRFNDDTAAELQPYLRPADDAAEFVKRNDEAARLLAPMDAMRLAISFTSAPATVPAADRAPAPDRMLHARVGGDRLGTFDLYFDARAPEQIVVGQVTTAHNEPYYDLWMSFVMRSVRNESAPASRFHGPTGPALTRDAFGVSRYTIHAAIDQSLGLSAEALLEGPVRQGGSRIVLFELSRQLQLKSVAMDGQALEFIQNEAIEGSQLSRRGNDLVAVVFPQPLVLGSQLQLKFTYAGSVLSDAGSGLFYVGARGTWYPNRGIAMANYDITFKFPQAYTLVATGRQVSLEQSGNQSIGHWVSDGPVPIAGFNLGRYVRTTAMAGEVAVDSYATHGVENELPQKTESVPVTTPRSVITPEGISSAPAPTTAPSLVVSGVSLAKRAAATITSLGNMFGPFPFRSLALTQRPGTDSQGWPGIVFLSSYVYLTPEERKAANVGTADNVLYGEVMMPHEVAHQWFGDRVSWASYHEQWLMEAIANYSSLMLLEKRRPRDFEVMMDAYRRLLATKSKDGISNVQAGPVTLGVRLSSSKFPAGYEIITYGRGTWLFHMLREMFRDGSRTPENPEGSDDVFVGVLRSIYQRYQGREITNAELESELEAVLPKSLWFENRRSLDWFFDGWVNGTVFPHFEIKDARFSGATGKVTATVQQVDAPDDLVTSIPVYGMAGESKVYLGRVFAEGPETRITLSVPPSVKRLVLDPGQTVLTAP